jgi:hypothetical protein
MTLPFSLLWPVLLLLWIVGLIVLPGYLIAFVLWRERLDVFERLGAAFALGFTLFAFQSLLGYLMGWPLDALFWLSSVTTMALILIAWLWRSERTLAVPNRPAPKRIDWQMGAMLLLVALVGAYISLGSGWYPRGDAAIHLQAIRKMMGQPELTQPIYSLNTQPVLWDHAYDAYYPLVALIARYSGLELTVVWHYLSGVLALLLPFVIYTLLKSLHAGRELILSSLFFFLLLGVFYPKPIAGTVFDALVYPNRVYLWLLLPIALALFFKYLTGGRKTYAVVSALVSISQILIHQNGFLFYYWILGGVLLLGLMLPKYRGMLMRRTVFALVVTTIAALPLLWIKWPYNQEFVRLATLTIWHRYYDFWYLNEQLYAFEPKGLVDLARFIGLVVAVVAIYRVLRTQNHTLPLVEILLGASFMIPLLVVYNPVIMPMIASAFSYTSVGRMLRIPPYYLAHAYGMVMILAAVKGLIKTDRAYRALKVSAYLGVCGAFLFVAQPGYSVTQQFDFDHQLPAIVQVASHLKPGSLVLSDVLTSTDIITFAAVYTLVLKFNGPVDLVDISAGRRVVHQVLVQDLPLETVLQVLAENKIDYILINMKSRQPKGIFATNPALFEPVYSDPRYVLYKVDLDRMHGGSQ